MRKADRAGPSLDHRVRQLQDVTVKGIVAKFEWTNPHSASPTVLELGGWNRTILKAGDRITIDYAPRRDPRTMNALLRHVRL